MRSVPEGLYKNIVYDLSHYAILEKLPIVEKKMQLIVPHSPLHSARALMLLLLDIVSIVLHFVTLAATHRYDSPNFVTDRGISERVAVNVSKCQRFKVTK